MKYSRFEDLPVWQAAIQLKLDLDNLCEQPFVRRRRNWIDQLDRAALSISNNIAEGFERGTTNELLMFLYIARGSAGEVRSMLRYLLASVERQQSSEQRSQISDLQSQIDSLISRSESISRQLHGWAKSLQNGDIKGVRHLTEQNKSAYHQGKRARQFWDQNRRAAQLLQEERLNELREKDRNNEPTDEA